MIPVNALEAKTLRSIEVLILDVDGVLTDGKITYTASGDEIKSFHARDGAGIAFWHAAGRRTAILSGRTSPAVERRAKELGIKPVLQGYKDKTAGLATICESLSVTPEQCAYIGDDLADLPVIIAVGVGIAVADAAAEVKESARTVTEHSGGRGAVREVIEALLRAQNLWAPTVARYQQEGSHAKTP